MDFFDFIRELRKGEPDVEKAAKAMKILGWICVFGAIWNYVIYFIAPFEKSPFNLPPTFPNLALVTFLLLGSLFFFSARGIKEGESRGKLSGQLAVILLSASFIGLLFFVFFSMEIPLSNNYFSIIFIIFITIFIAQFAVPAYFGVRYLGRLPVKDIHYPSHRFKSEYISKIKDTQISSKIPEYKDALFPFGIFGTFALLLAVPLVAFFVMEKYYGPEKTAFMFMPTFLFIFLSPILYNLIPSTFQRDRELISSFSGSGSIFLFHGTWPFFKLLIYKDGVEIRVMFHRFFIPYDKMEDLPEKIGFFNRGILIKSNSPDVPSGIRFQGFGMKKILEIVKENKNNFKDIL